MHSPRFGFFSIRRYPGMLPKAMAANTYHQRCSQVKHHFRFLTKASFCIQELTWETSGTSWTSPWCPVPSHHSITPWRKLNLTSNYLKHFQWKFLKRINLNQSQPAFDRLKRSNGQSQWKLGTALEDMIQCSSGGA